MRIGEINIGSLEGCRAAFSSLPLLSDCTVVFGHHELSSRPASHWSVQPHKSHQHRANGKFAPLCAAGEVTKISSGRADMTTFFQDAGNDSCRVLRS